VVRFGALNDSAQRQFKVLLMDEPIPARRSSPQAPTGDVARSTKQRTTACRDDIAHAWRRLPRWVADNAPIGIQVVIGDDSGGRQEETAASRWAQLREAPNPQDIARRGCCFEESRKGRL
jgi:hypothetical protein